MGEQTVEAEDWRERLAASLEGLRRLAVLGIGNELYGDDGAGVALARSLARSGIDPGKMQAFEAGPAPENFTGSLRKMNPSHVLMVDAANLGLEPGSIRVIDMEQITGAGFSTHTLPLHILADFIAREGCRVVMLGIQPRDLSFGEGLSPEVSTAVTQLKNYLKDLLTGNGKRTAMR